MADKLQAWRRDLLKRLSELCSLDGRVPRHIAEDLVKQSAWWETHPSGPVRAPGHAERIDGDERSWLVKFGANSFLVAAAVHGCCERIRQWVHEQQAVPVPRAWEKLNWELHAVVRSSVANYRGDTYADYGHDTQGKLLFGAQAIYVSDVVGVLAGYLKTPELRTFQGRASTKPVPRKPRRDTASLVSRKVICPQCQCEVSLSKLGSHMKKRCSNRGNANAHVGTAQQAAKAKASRKPAVMLSPGFTICPRCQATVRTSGLKGHLANACPNRPKPSDRAASGSKGVATSDQRLERVLGKNEAICPWCNARMNKKRLADHQAKRCPKRPQSTSKTK